VEDNGLENSGWSQVLREEYNYKVVKILAYNSQATGYIEHGNQTLLRSLLKMTKGGVLDWALMLPLVLWVDRTTVKSSTGFTPAYLVYGSEVVLPIELQIDTWPYLP